MTEQTIEYGVSTIPNDGFGTIRLDVHDFIKKREQGRINTYSLSFLTRNKYSDIFSFLDDIERNVKKTYPDINVQSHENETIKISGKDYLIICTYHASEYSIIVYGSKQFCLNIKSAIGKEDNKVQLNWWYSDEHGEFNDRHLDLEFNYQVYDEHYPYIKGGLESYFREYQKSSAPILLCMGEAGTGKTSFIKHFIKTYKLNTMVTYDDRIMSSDFFYIQYLVDTQKQLMVIEDADVLLSPRESDANPAMSKLLNISDGLIKLESKKIIFSTNIQTYSKIDSALIRPGRCFDVINFRKLTHEEAVNGCKAANLPEVEENREYTLSEIFNRREHSFHGQRIGFGL